MVLRLTTLFATLFLLTMVGGCESEDSEANLNPSDKTQAIAQGSTLDFLPTDGKKTSCSPANESPKPDLLQAMADYVAPYPERLEMFAPPKMSQTSRQRSDGEGGVQLMGVVDVGEPRAVLDIEGATTLLAVGSEKYGVKVVAIQQRTVILERGQVRWSAAIE